MSDVRLTRCSSHRPSGPAYYFVNCRISDSKQMNCQEFFREKTTTMKCAFSCKERLGNLESYLFYQRWLNLQRYFSLAPIANKSCKIQSHHTNVVAVWYGAYLFLFYFSQLFICNSLVGQHYIQCLCLKKKHFPRKYEKSAL